MICMRLPNQGETTMTDKEALTLILAAATEYWSQNVPANQDLKSALQKVEGALGYFKKPKAEAQ
jgi:hypothetical protein